MKLSSQSKYLKPVYNIFDKKIVEDANLTHVLPNFFRWSPTSSP